MDNNEIKAVLLSWELEPKLITSIYSSAWEIDGYYMLKHGKDTAEMAKSLFQTIRVTTALCEN